MRTVCFRVGGREFSIERHAAAIFATNLDKLSTGKLGDYGRAGAPSLLDDVVVGNSHDTIELEGDEAEAAFYVLNVSIDAPKRSSGNLPPLVAVFGTTACEANSAIACSSRSGRWARVAVPPADTPWARRARSGMT